ncbi:MAG TPA: lipid-A-disaccharide synthase N-terminal domain-containing protein [Phycisphaerales bacterium]|nr:lipid-A-disaccharide synthase N-terminal domain-containing protein [Phycisphaerales bacterium]
MKWEPLAAMVGLLFLGVWLMWSPGEAVDAEPDARTQALQIGSTRGVLEAARDPGTGEPRFRIHYRRGPRTQWVNAEEFRRAFGLDPEAVSARPDNALFRLFNISTWTSLAWVLIGLAGQAAFFGRMMLQWVVSERERRSVVPEAFWWLSLFGGAALFAYFVWRQDMVGVIGQTSGVVIYARNIRLMRKARRDEPAAPVAGASANPAELAPDLRSA